MASAFSTHALDRTCIRTRNRTRNPGTAPSAAPSASAGVECFLYSTKSAIQLITASNYLIYV